MTVYTPQMVTPIFIAQFTNIWKPRQNGGYDICGLFTEPVLDTDEWKSMIAEVTKACKEEFGSDFGKADIERLRNADKFPIRDAGEKSGEWKGFEPGRKYINMKRTVDDGRPEVIDVKYNDVIDESLLYPGVLCRASLKFRAYENNYGPGVSCYFEHIQLMKSGLPRLDNTVSAKTRFQKAEAPSASAEAVLKDMGIEASSAGEDDGDDLGV